MPAVVHFSSSPPPVGPDTASAPISAPPFMIGEAPGKLINYGSPWKGAPRGVATTSGSLAKSPLLMPFFSTV